MKLDTARTLVHVLNTKQSPIQESVKLSAEVLGLGPSFVVRIGVMNIGPKSGAGSVGISDLALFFHWNDKFYDVSPPIIHVCIHFNPKSTYTNVVFPSFSPIFNE